MIERLKDLEIVTLYDSLGHHKFKAITIGTIILFPIIFLLVFIALVSAIIQTLFQLFFYVICKVAMFKLIDFEKKRKN